MLEGPLGGLAVGVSSTDDAFKGWHASWVPLLLWPGIPGSQAHLPALVNARVGCPGCEEGLVEAWWAQVQGSKGVSCLVSPVWGLGEHCFSLWTAVPELHCPQRSHFRLEGPLCWGLCRTLAPLFRIPSPQVFSRHIGGGTEGPLWATETAGSLGLTLSTLVAAQGAVTW